MLPGREALEALTHYDFVVTYVRALVERDDAHQDAAGCPQSGEMRSRREVAQEVCKKTGIMGLRPLAPVGPQEHHDLDAARSAGRAHNRGPLRTSRAPTPSSEVSRCLRR